MDDGKQSGARDRIALHGHGWAAQTRSSSAQARVWISAHDINTVRRLPLDGA
jgi:hypothetical protein